MGYFANGTCGDLYETCWCSRCVHQGGCAVWLLHLAWNYEQVGDETKKAALDSFIPRQGIENAQCQMFYEKEGAQAEVEWLRVELAAAREALPDADLLRRAADYADAARNDLVTSDEEEAEFRSDIRAFQAAAARIREARGEG